ncbi:hypothetical protein X975_02635, partial [Stegodyphus mimosarum]
MDGTLAMLENLMQTMETDNLIITGDFNAKSRVWGSPITDPRGSKIQDFVTAHDMCIINDSDSPPTFTGSRENSWIDLTILRNKTGLRIENWKIAKRNTLSDHNAINFEINLKFQFTKIGLRMKRS